MGSAPSSSSQTLPPDVCMWPDQNVGQAKAARGGPILAPCRYVAAHAGRMCTHHDAAKPIRECLGQKALQVTCIHAWTCL